MDTEILKSASLKATKKRLMILNILEAESKPVTAEFIFERLSDDVDISLSTVYRALNAMANKDIIIKSIHMDGKTYYQLNNEHHKHELICSVCHKSIDVEDCPFDKIAQEIADKTGFIITGHNMEITGICPNCISQLNDKE